MKDYSTPEEMIISLISQNRGTHNFIDKDALISMASENGIDVDDRISKREIAIKVAELIGYKELSQQANVGVSSYELQQRLGISDTIIKRMVRDGFISVTGYEFVRIYGKYRKCPLYNVYDCFKTNEQIQEWLKEHNTIQKG